MIIKRLPGPQAIYWRVLALIIVLWFLEWLIYRMLRDSHWSPPAFLIGLNLGTIFQLTVFAAAWGALGPGKLLWRVPSSLACVWAVAFAASWLNPYLVYGSSEIVGLVLILTALWSVAFALLWLTAFAFGLRLRYQAEFTTQDSALDSTRDHQFGIRQFMIFTAFVAVMAGIARWILSSKLLPGSDNRFIALNAMLILIQLVISLPLIVGGLLQRRIALATVIGLALVVLVSVAEYKTIPQLPPSAAPELSSMSAWNNFFSVLWVLTFTAVVRGSGYRFGLPTPEQGIQYVGPLREHEPRRLPEQLPEIVFQSPPMETPPPNPQPSEGVVHIQE